MESAIKLSILIPTFNHGEYIKVLLESIISQVERRKDVEVLIADNASTDNTSEICLSFCKKSTNLKYKRNESNLGFDLNVVGLINSSLGRFSWIIGSDDWLESVAIETVISCIDRFPGLTGITAEINTYGKFMEQINILENNADCIELEGSEEIYLSNKIGYRFGFISAHIFNTGLAKFAIDKGMVLYNKHSVHSMLTHLVRLRASWLFISRPLVAWRSGNDSILSKEGIHKRYLVDVTAYLDNVAITFGKGSNIYNRFVNEQLVYCMRGYLVQASKLDIPSYQIRIDMVRRFWSYRGFWLRIAPLIMMPGFLISVASRIRKKNKGLYKRK